LNTPQFRFGENEVDPATRQVTHAGRSLRTEPKVFDVLVLLLRQKNGDVQKRERLFLITPRIIQSAAASLPVASLPAASPPASSLPAVSR
jgi:DNA-binding winged helix-turn-helix (wHTH) protein